MVDSVEHFIINCILAFMLNILFYIKASFFQNMFKFLVLYVLDYELYKFLFSESSSYSFKK